MQLVTSEEWNARLPVHTTPLRSPVNMTFIHHSAGSRCYTLQECSATIRSIVNYHLDAKGKIDLCICVWVCVDIALALSIYLSIYLFIYRSIVLSISISLNMLPV